MNYIQCLMRLAILLIAMAAGPTAFAASLKFCFVAWPPYTKVIGADPTGISIDIAKQAASLAGFEPSFQELPWKRCLAEADAGQYDAVIDTSRRDDGTQFLYPEHYSSTWTDGFWVNDKSPLTQYTSLEQFHGRSFGLVNGYSYPEEIKSNPHFSVDYSNNDEAALRKLAINRVDVVVTDIVSGIEILKNIGEKRVRYLKPVYAKEPLYFAFYRKNSIQRTLFDQELGKMLKDGSVDKVYLKHLNVTFAELQAGNQ